MDKAKIKEKVQELLAEGKTAEEIKAYFGDEETEGYEDYHNDPVKLKEDIVEDVAQYNEIAEGEKIEINFVPASKEEIDAKDYETQINKHEDKIKKLKAEEIIEYEKVPKNIKDTFIKNFNYNTVYPYISKIVDGKIDKNSLKNAISSVHKSKNLFAKYKNGAYEFNFPLSYYGSEFMPIIVDKDTDKEILYLFWCNVTINKNGKFKISSITEYEKFRKNSSDEEESDWSFENDDLDIDDNIFSDKELKEMAKERYEDLINTGYEASEKKILDSYMQEAKLLKEAKNKGYKYSGFEAHDEGRTWFISKDGKNYKEYFTLNMDDDKIENLKKIKSFIKTMEELKAFINEKIEGRELTEDDIPEVAGIVVERLDDIIMKELEAYEPSEGEQGEKEYVQILTQIIKQLKADYNIEAKDYDAEIKKYEYKIKKLKEEKKECEKKEKEKKKEEKEKKEEKK